MRGEDGVKLTIDHLVMIHREEINRAEGKYCADRGVHEESPQEKERGRIHE